jgi:quercetin dioxygenase-like cupin family protein
MRSRLLWILVLLYLVAIRTGSAQDPLKIESAHYKLAFENDAVQVVYIHYGPHEKSTMHQHPAGVVVNLTDGHLRFFEQNGSVQEVRAIHGEARWFPPFKHRVENLSDTSYDGVYIAVKGKANVSGALQKGVPITGDAAADKLLLSVLQAARARSQ